MVAASPAEWSDSRSSRRSLSCCRFRKLYQFETNVPVPWHLIDFAEWCVAGTYIGNDYKDDKSTRMERFVNWNEVRMGGREMCTEKELDRTLTFPDGSSPFYRNNKTSKICRLATPKLVFKWKTLNFRTVPSLMTITLHRHGYPEKAKRAIAQPRKKSL